MKSWNNNRIRECREALCLSANYVAGLLDVSSVQLEEMEVGKLRPTEGQMERLAHIFGCPADYLLGQEEVHEPSGVLHRKGDGMTTFDREQVQAFLAFQREVSKQYVCKH